MSAHIIAAISVMLAIVQAPASPPQARPAAATGTAIVSGVVVSSADPAQPVRRAIVTLSGRGEISRGAVTDDEGRFAIGFLPGGTYTLTVAKPAHLTTAFGSMGPGRPGTPFVVREGETIANLRIPLTRGAAISGTVRDHTGAGAEGAQVFAVRAELAKGRPTEGATQSVEVVTTDDTGAYRIFGLPPGTYIVGAMSKVSTSGGIGAPTREQVEADLRALQQRGTAAAPPAGASAPPSALEVVGYAPVFHPAAVSSAQAATVTVGAGEDRPGTDIFLTLVPMATIDGVVIGADGQPAPNVVIGTSTLGPPMPSSVTLLASMLSPLPGSDGRFKVPNVAPGTWTITARSSGRVVTRDPTGALRSVSGNATDLPPGTFYWAAATVEVNGGAPSVTLRLRPGLTMTGRVVFDGATPQPANAAQVRLSMAPDPDPVRVATALFPGSPPAVANPAADGSFELRGLTPGAWVLTAIVPGAAGPGGWWLRSAMANGKDLLDAPIDVSDRDLAGVNITLSNRHTEIAGTLIGAPGKPVSDLAIVVMPEDRALWASARRVQQTRPATDGRFSFADLPPGSYLLAAVTNVAADNWRTEEFLGAIAPAGVKVAIGEGEKKAQDLRVR